jgi:hypothetical protein
MITLQTRRGPVEIEPLAERGGLAFHPEIRDGEAGEPDGPTFTITHVASGLAVLDGLYVSPEDGETLLWLLGKLTYWGRSGEEIRADPDAAMLGRARKLLLRAGEL